VVKAVDQAMLDVATASAKVQGETLAGPFAPGIPLTPFDGVSGMPRAWNFPTGYNIKSRADRDGRLDFQLLKALTDTYDVAAACINHRIDDVRSLDWSIRPADWVERGDGDSDAVDRAKAALRRPDGRNGFRSWLAMYLQDVLRYDAGCLYRRRNMIGQVCALEVVSGTTIAPVLDYYGRRPMSPAPAYVQYVDGQPWEWLTEDDLIYQPFRPQPDSPYGIAPLEHVLLTANTHMRFQKHWMDWFTEGNIPEGFATAPETITTPEQLEQWEAYWAAMNTDTRVKHKLKMVPHGTVMSFPQEKNFDPTFPLYLMRVVCAAYHVTPNDLGFTEDVNRATGDTQVDVQFRIGTLPLVQHIQDILTAYLQDDLGLPVVFEFDTGQESEDRVATAQADKIYMDAAVVSPDEIRERRYGLPTNAGRPVPRSFDNSRQGRIPLRSLFAVAGPIDPQTGAPSEDVPLDTTPFAGTPGITPDKQPGAPTFERAPIDPDDPLRPGLEVAVPGSGTVAPPAPAAPAAPIGNDPAVVKELGKWKANTLTRIGRGQRPRRFESDIIPPSVIEKVWHALNAATDSGSVEGAFRDTAGADADPKAGTPSWRDDPPVRTPQHDVDLELTDYWAPRVAGALQSLWSRADLSAAITAAMYNRDRVVKDQTPPPPIAGVLAGTADTTGLEVLLPDMHADAFNIGVQAAQVQLGMTPDGWDTWKPGMDSSMVTGANGWAAVTQSQGVTIKGITDTTVTRVGNAIESGVAAGGSVDSIARDVNRVLSDPARAELIAHTESARMLSAASMGQYQSMGVTEWELMTSAGACPICLDIAANNPHPVKDTTDTPPVHPRCRCAAAPVAATIAPSALGGGLAPADMAPAAATVADTLTAASTAAWTDDELTAAIATYAEDPEAVDKILALIDQREAAGTVATAAEVSPIPAWVEPSPDPFLNPAIRPARKLTPAQQANEEYDSYVYNQYNKALDDLNGVFYNQKMHAAARAAGYDEMTMFMGQYRSVEKYASDELKEWWLYNGRETQGSFRYKMLGRSSDKKYADVVQKLGFGKGKG
jgi:SPP1 gp7 family putative phage head morphogenesis protein